MRIMLCAAVSFHRTTPAGRVKGLFHIAVSAVKQVNTSEHRGALEKHETRVRRTQRENPGFTIPDNCIRSLPLASGESR